MLIGAWSAPLVGDWGAVVGRGLRICVELLTYLARHAGRLAPLSNRAGAHSILGTLELAFFAGACA